MKTHPVLEWKEKVLNQTFDMVAKSKNPHEKKRQQLREQIMLKHVLAKKKEQQKRLKEWEREINEICVSTAKITVENQVDFEGPPRQMTFISEYKPAAGIVIPDDPPIGKLNFISPNFACLKKSWKNSRNFVYIQATQR